MAILCILAAIVLIPLALFSAKYRPLAREALGCAFRTMTLRKCNSNFNERVKSNLTATVGKLSPSLGRFMFTRFGALSTLFTLLMFASLISFGWGVWNFYQYGNCNGPESTDFCIFDPLASGEHGFSRTGTERTLTPPTDFTSIIEFGNSNSQVTLYEFACYSCPYTKKAEDEVMGRIRTEFSDRVRFILKPFPLPNHVNSEKAVESAFCAKAQGKYWEMHAKLFEFQALCTQGDTSLLGQMANDIGLNLTQFNECMDSNKHAVDVNLFYNQAIQSGIYGTPTFFIGTQSFVGNVTYDQLSNALNQELARSESSNRTGTN